MGIIARLFGRLLCRIWGHRRGRRVLVVKPESGAAVSWNDIRVDIGHTLYQCGRCSATWTRKVKAAK